MENNIAAIRKERNLSQKELAEKIGVSHWWLNHIERGKRNPSIDLVQKIAVELEVTPGEIFL